MLSIPHQVQNVPLRMLRIDLQLQTQSVLEQEWEVVVRGQPELWLGLASLSTALELVSILVLALALALLQVVARNTTTDCEECSEATLQRQIQWR